MVTPTRYPPPAPMPGTREYLHYLKDIQEVCQRSIWNETQLDAAVDNIELFLKKIKQRPATICR